MASHLYANADRGQVIFGTSYICFITDLGALQRDELGGLVGHRAGRLGAGGARRRLGHLLILVLESLLTKVAFGLRLETLHRLRPCRSPLPSSEILGDDSIDIWFHWPNNDT